MRGVLNIDKIQKIRANSDGLYAGTCVKVTSFEGYTLSDIQHAETPHRREGMSAKAHKMLALMCCIHPTHIVTHKFIMGMMGWSHNTAYKYIQEAAKHKAIVAYRLVSKDYDCKGVGYRPITYPVNYKYAKAKNVHKKVRGAFKHNREVVRNTEYSDQQIRTGHIHTNVIHDQQIHTGSVRTNVGDDQQIRTGSVVTNSDSAVITNSETGNLVTPFCVNKNLQPYLSKVKKRSKTSASSCAPGGLTSDVKKKRKQRTGKICIEACRNEYRKIVEILLEISKDGATIDIENLSAQLARSIDHRVNPEKLGTLTLEKAIQLRTLRDAKVLPELTCLELVRNFNKIMLYDECTQVLKRIINETVTAYAGVFPGQREYHQYRQKLYGLEECIAFVRSSLTTYEVFQKEYKKRNYSALYNPIALTQAARIYRPDWRWCKSITFAMFYDLDIHSRAYLSRDCERDADSFREVYGLEVFCPVNILWWDEEAKAKHAFKRIGLDFNAVKEEIDKAGSNYYNTEEIADIVAPHLNKAALINVGRYM